jgi:hypothetical protein
MRSEERGEVWVWGGRVRYGKMMGWGRKARFGWNEMRFSMWLFWDFVNGQLHLDTRKKFWHNLVVR